MSSGRSGDPSAASTEEGTQSMLTIWGRKNSSNVRKALWCAEEAGLEYRTVDAGGAFGLVDEPAFRAMNPNGRVPVIEDDGFVLWESNAIVRYLAARYAPGDLYPQDPVRRADADKWMDWTTSTLAGPFRDLFWGTLRTPPEQRDEALIAKALQTCGELLRVPDQTLAGQPWLSGERFGMGDIPLGCFIYYGNGFQALKGIDLDVAEGDFFALLGPNGAGKSTTIGILSTLVNKTSGSVSVFGHDLDKDPAGLKRCLGVVPQEFNFNQFEKVFDIVVTQAGYYGIPAKIAKERAERYLTQLGLWDKRNEASRMLSGGMKRRLMIARALVHQPRLLILDEPTAGVDIELRRSMWSFLTELNQEGISIILTTHYLEEAEQLCRNIAIIDHGEIVQNTSMRDLLMTLHSETFLLDLKNVQALPPTLDGYPTRLVDDHTLEVQVEKSQGINDLFAQLGAQGIEVLSLRNKTNRLEELFVSLVEKNLTRIAR